MKAHIHDRLYIILTIILFITIWSIPVIHLLTHEKPAFVTYQMIQHYMLTGETK